MKRVEKQKEQKKKKEKRKIIKMSLSGLKDTDREILKHIGDEELLKICSLNRKTWNEVCDDNFLRRRLMRYPGIEKYKSEKESWKQFFLRAIYYISKMEEDFKFIYSEGDFKKQYNLLTQYNDEKLLFEASKEGDLSMVKYALGQGVNIHAGDDIALQRASENGHLEVVRYLIEKGANVGGFQNYALQEASKNGHLEVVKYLIKHGADVNAIDGYALTAAIGNGHLNVVKILVENGANVNMRNPLSDATSLGDFEIVKYLVEHGANIHAIRPYSLRSAAEDGHSKVVEYLLEHGADVHALDDEDLGWRNRFSNYLRSFIE